MTFTLGSQARAAGVRLKAFDAIASTNTEALIRARAGECGPVWFATTEQTAGKGRRGRMWIAPRGNLACSFLDVLDVIPGTAATLGFVAGLALVSALESVSRGIPVDYRLKWPNDVLANGAKLSGILLEAETVADGRLAIVVGLGTNVVAAPPGPSYRATSLAALGVAADAEQIFAALSEFWQACCSVWDGGRGFNAIRTRWLARAAGLGEAVSVSTGNATLTGIFETIDDAGCLIVKMPNGTRKTIAAGDVYFGSAASAGAPA